MRVRWSWLFVVFVVVVLADRALALDGKALYQRHCERCHGAEGRGDGSDAELFETRPRDLRSGFLDRYDTDELVRRVRSGMPLMLALDLPALRARAGEVEALAAHLERLPTVDWRQVEEGQAVYLDRCELCHGPAGEPGPTVPKEARAPRNLADPSFQRGITDTELTTAIRHGKEGMPPIRPPLAAPEVPEVIAFVRLLSPGYVLYDRYCAACHGDDGRGAGSLTEEVPRPSIVFDRAYFRRRGPEEVRAAIWHMLATQRPAMPHLRGTLSEPETRAIIAFLRHSGSGS